jgi:hypothetical protein
MDMRFAKLAFTLSALLIAGTAQASETAGSRYFQLAAPSVVGPASATIFTPSANVAGATIRTLSGVSAASTQLFVLEVYPDGTTRVIFSLVAAAGASVVNGTLPYALDIPPGVGLSVVQLLTANAQLYLTYDFR